MRNTKSVKRKTLGDSNILSKEELYRRIYEEDEELKIVITPLLKPSDQISSTSIDVRLGTEFIIFKRRNFSLLDPIADDITQKIGEYQERIYIPPGQKLYLHPRQFVLGSTLEYTSLPCDVLAYVTGRSSWGRLGLMIATATVIHPNYKGIITLELANLGDAPIALTPGIRVAQLIFHKCSKTKMERASKYFMSVRPTFARVYEEPEREALRDLSIY